MIGGAMIVAVCGAEAVLRAESSQNFALDSIIELVAKGTNITYFPLESSPNAQYEMQGNADMYKMKKRRR